MSLTVSNVYRHSAGSQIKVNCTAAITTGSETILASDLGLAYIQDGQVTDSKGFAFDFTPSADGSSEVVAAYYVTSAITSPLTALAGGASNVSVKLAVYGK